MTKLRIVAAVVDTKQLTLYKEDGTTLFIKQGDPRLRKILSDITPVIAAGLVAEVDLSVENAYRNFEEQSGGLVQFFRVSKKKVANFFSFETEEVSPVEPQAIRPPVYLGDAIEDILAHSVSVSHGSFSEIETTTDDTMIAVVTDGQSRSVIPSMENLRGQFDYANRLGSRTGVLNFLRRISLVIEKRQHSIHDLLKFMEKGDLPIADDGSIIIYKILKRNTKGGYVDCHTRNVHQKIGSFVCMDEKLVDPNRRNECSNGLHVARRGYISGFSGDVCVLAKLAPEDVIAVPTHDANKMRVCGYHILFELTKEDHAKLKMNQPMTGTKEAQIMLGKAISGDHIGRIEEVRINSGYGTNVVITQLGKSELRPAPTEQVKHTAIDKEEAVDIPVDPKAVAKQVTAEKAKAAPTPAITPVAAEFSNNADQAFELFKNGNYAGLIAFKKAKKKSWDSLRIGNDMVALVMSLPTQTATPISPKPKAEPKPKAKVAAKAQAKREKTVKLSSSIVGKKVNMVTLDDLPDLKTMSTQKQARLHFNLSNWKILAAFKKSKRKSWTVLGFSDAEVAEIKLHTGD